MYNMVFGMNPLSGPLMAALQIDPDRVGRFRDCYLARDEERLVIHVLTRNGGGNREHYGAVRSAECECAGCFMEFRADKMAGYIRDFDDTFDSTYASIVFAVPTELEHLLNQISIRRPEVVQKPLHQRFQGLLEALHK